MKEENIMELLDQDNFAIQNEDKKMMKKKRNLLKIMLEKRGVKELK